MNISRLAEKEHARSEILKSNGKTNSIRKILNRYIPGKNTPLANVENPLLLENKLNEFYHRYRYNDSFESHEASRGTQF